ncbi:MAG: thioredoxin family protein, partial [Ignavibacteriaceae bacterium]|nr:thioredoxin family protein [Ignavibacteriaceae bacterium]
MSFTELMEILNNDGVSYLQYTNEAIQYIESTDPSKMNETEKSLYDYTKLNLQRSARIDKSFTPSEELKLAVADIKENQIWMVITENWCGDSAQILPVIEKTASLSGSIQLKIIGRDSHPEIMNLYLTNGTLSIPV